MELSLATNRELIEELVNRHTFAGVVVGVEQNVTIDTPKAGAKCIMAISRVMQASDAKRLLTDALNRLD